MIFKKKIERNMCIVGVVVLIGFIQYFTKHDCLAITHAKWTFKLVKR